MLLVVAPEVIRGEDPVWRAALAAGQDAFRQGRYAQAEVRLSAALKAVDHTGGDAAQVAGSLV